MTVTSARLTKSVFLASAFPQNLKIVMTIIRALTIHAMQKQVNAFTFPTILRAMTVLRAQKTITAQMESANPESMFTSSVLAIPIVCNITITIIATGF